MAAEDTISGALGTYCHSCSKDHGKEQGHQVAMEGAGNRIFGDVLGRQCSLSNRPDPQTQHGRQFWCMKQALVFVRLLEQAILE